MTEKKTTSTQRPPWRERPWEVPLLGTALGLNAGTIILSQSATPFAATLGGTALLLTGLGAKRPEFLYAGGLALLGGILSRKMGGTPFFGHERKTETNAKRNFNQRVQALAARIVQRRNDDLPSDQPDAASLDGLRTADDAPMAALDAMNAAILAQHLSPPEALTMVSDQPII